MLWPGQIPSLVRTMLALLASAFRLELAALDFACHLEMVAFACWLEMRVWWMLGRRVLTRSLLVLVVACRLRLAPLRSLTLSTAPR